MRPYQRQRAIDLLGAITEVAFCTIEAHEDWELDAWLGELGFEWISDDIFGAWKPIVNDPAFGSVQPAITDNGDFGPLFSEVHS